MFGISAATTLSFCQPVVKGRTPGQTDLGVLVGPVNIAKNTTDQPVATLTLKGTGTSSALVSYTGTALTYNGDLQQLIHSVDSVKLNASSSTTLRFKPTETTGEDPGVQQVKVYLRVGNSSTALPSAASDWVEYVDETSLQNANLKRMEATGISDGDTSGNTDTSSDYYVFYYIDGLDNIRDNGAGANGTGDGSVTP